MKNVSNPQNITKFFGFLLVAPLSIPFVYAYSNIPQFFDTGFRGIFNTLGRDSVMNGLTVFFFFLLVYTAIIAAAKRVKIFNDSEKLNKSGKIFAFAISSLSTIGLFFLGRYGGFREMVHSVLTVAQVWGMVVFGIMVFLLVYYGFRQEDEKPHTCIALMALGLALILPAYIMQWNGWYSFGLLLLVIGGIWCLIRLFDIFFTNRSSLRLYFTSCI